MKKVVLLMAVLWAVSCSREQMGESPLVEWTFDTEYGRASLSDGGVFSWQQGDRIDIWNTTSGSFVPFTTLAGKGRFSATAPADARFSGAAFYPAGIAGGVSFVTLPASYASPEAATAAFPMYAPVSAGDQLLHFKHLGAMVSVTVTRVLEEVTRLELRSGSTLLSGRFDLTTVSGNPEICQQSGSGSVAVGLSLSGEETVCVTFPVPTGSYPISICLGNAGGDLLVISSSGSLTFDRANRYKIKAFDYMTERYAFDSGVAVEALSLEDDSANW